jgi:transcriptional regulator with GAF, ATPase, and Fis domain
LGWIAISIAILLMAIRRSITFGRLVLGDLEIQPDLSAELVALVISMLMLMGIAKLAPVFRSIEQSNIALEKANRALKALSQCNHILVRSRNETHLLEDVCQMLIEISGYRFSWVGYAQHDEEQSVIPVANAGVEAGYLEQLQITWADKERGRGPTGTAIRTGQPKIARDLMMDQDFRPWRMPALKRGYASSIALPLKHEGIPFGALNIYSEEYDAFDEEEINLLNRMAEDLSYGIMALRMRERSRSPEPKRT